MSFEDALTQRNDQAENLLFFGAWNGNCYNL